MVIALTSARSTGGDASVQLRGAGEPDPGERHEWLRRRLRHRKDLPHLEVVVAVVELEQVIHQIHSRDHLPQPELGVVVADIAVDVVVAGGGAQVAVDIAEQVQEVRH